ncbi:unnamed protein product [Protopolystoma xenopodis]|uniref:Uncharacterized protein n=1 Tax=Protopolystoma xenopodis TaxID=117903 RepID=A0A448XNT8_9PLAT|nr:unnamed protein product [Protopolystoma xenopodis]
MYPFVASSRPFAVTTDYQFGCFDESQPASELGRSTEAPRTGSKRHDRSATCCLRDRQVGHSHATLKCMSNPPIAMATVVLSVCTNASATRRHRIMYAIFTHFQLAKKSVSGLATSQITAHPFRPRGCTR